MTGESDKFQLRISRLLVLFTIALTSSTAFFLGCAFRVLNLNPDELNKVSDHVSEGTDTNNKFNMPPPVLDSSKSMPETMYTEQQYDVDRAIRNSHHLHIVTSTDEECDARNESCGSENSPEEHTESDDEKQASEDDHLPAGQHLLVDIKNVDASFLDSEERLAQAMVDIVSQSKLTMLSYHCHSLLPMGVSCVGVLLESHISFHTWPVEGVITLDLFTCGSGLLIPLMPLIESLFAIPRPNAGKYMPGPDADLENYLPKEEDLVKEPLVLWKHELRGFRPPLGLHTYRPLESDVGEVSSEFSLPYKKEILQLQTPFQLIDIWDVITPVEGDNSYEQYIRSLRTEIDTYESRNPELFRPERIVFLEGVLQSTSYGDEAYHEAMVHPAMFAHDNPKRVAIIGGGEGATLREVLKHKSVELVKMIEIDEMMVSASREHLPGWSDCSDIQGSAKSCFEDDRSDIVFDDALAYFLNNGIEDFVAPDDDNNDDSEDDSSSDDSSEDEKRKDKDLYDIIIMDALDPQEMVEFAATLYNTDNFAVSLFNSLEEDGILVMQLGSSPEHNEPAESNSLNFRRQQIMDFIVLVGFEVVQVYEESHCNFGNPWSFMVACKDMRCRDNWYKNEANVAFAIHERMRPTISGLPPLKYFDGATMRSYQMPSKQWGSAYCKKTPTPNSCVIADGFDKKTKNIPVTQLEVKISGFGDHAGRGVFAKTELKENSYIAIESSLRKVFAPFETMDTIEILREEDPKIFKELDKLYNYIDGYGYPLEKWRTFSPEYYVDPDITTFMNHGCNNTDNIVDSKFQQFVKNHPPFDPIFDRHFELLLMLDVTEEDIEPGEELLCDYEDFEEDYFYDESTIRDMCERKMMGSVKSIEMSKEV